MSPHPHRAIAGNSDDPRGRVERVKNETGGAISRPGRLTEQQFWALADVPAEAEWFANIRNKHTRRAYKLDVHDFLNFNRIDVNHLTAIRAVTRPHVIAWRKELERRELAPSTIRRKLSAVSALFEFLCENNAIYLNPVNGVERPAADSNEGKTPAIGDAQARQLLASPAVDTLKGKRDGAILATFLYHGLRAEELVKLKVKVIQERPGVKYFRVYGKGSKIRYIPIHRFIRRRWIASMRTPPRRDMRRIWTGRCFGRQRFLPATLARARWRIGRCTM